jgi:hypothetical protein
MLIIILFKKAVDLTVVCDFVYGKWPYFKRGHEACAKDVEDGYQFIKKGS